MTFLSPRGAAPIFFFEIFDFFGHFPARSPRLSLSPQVPEARRAGTGWQRPARQKKLKFSKSEILLKLGSVHLPTSI